MLERVDQMGAPAPGAMVPSMTLGTYLAEAGRALRTGLPRAWVDAVVLEAKVTARGIAVEFVEPFADERADGRLKGMIWSRALTGIEEKIGLPLDAATLKGTHVRALIKTTFHPRWHLEGEVLDLDPAMVQGLVERRLEAIRATLRNENLYGAQQKLDAPEDITNVAVIHPAGSAGWADVRTELERLQARGIVTVSSHPIAFEGAKAAGGIADTIAAIAAGPLPDLILIVRGGGAASSLAGLANLAMARAVCRCPVPVVTGIGHASDRTILDDCAWRAADTPSKALGVVKTILRRHCHEAHDAHRTILDTVAFHIGGTLQPLLANACDALVEAAGRTIVGQDTRLRDLAHSIECHLITFRGTIDLSQAELDRVAADLVVTAPAAPSRAGKELTALHAGMLHTASCRLPERRVLAARAEHAGSLVAAFVARQATEVQRAFSAMESAVRRRLAEEGARLAAAGEAAKALDLEATLSRGFVLPLDNEHRIIRSAEAAHLASGFALLFVDGQARVQVDPRPTMP